MFLLLELQSGFPVPISCTKAMSHSFVYPFIHQIFVKHLLCVRCWMSEIRYTVCPSWAPTQLEGDSKINICFQALERGSSRGLAVYSEGFSWTERSRSPPCGSALSYDLRGGNWGWSHLAGALCNTAAWGPASTQVGLPDTTPAPNIWLLALPPVPMLRPLSHETPAPMGRNSVEGSWVRL